YDDGRPFYAMRLIRGDSLKREIQRFHAEGTPGPDPGEQALALRQLLRQFLDVCNAMEYAHSRGVLHRDLKPDNIMVGKYGETLVVDWGLAKPIDRPASGATGSETRLVPASVHGTSGTQPGSALGTPAYMSPEQAAGALDRLGPASDIYSLGATLYHLLTGRAPFQGEPADRILERVRRGDFPPPRRVRPGTDPALESICLKAMAPRPEGRYATARALADDLEHWLADEPVAAYREPWGRRLARWSRRHRAWVQAGTVAALGITLCSVAMAIAIRHAWILETQRAQKLATARADGEARILAGRAAVSDQDWPEAQRQLSRAIAEIGLEPELDPLEDLAAPLLAEAERHLADQDALRTARETYRRFQDLHERALFHATQALGLDPAASREATVQAIRDALALMGMTDDGAGGPVLSHPDLRARAETITAGGSEMLLLLAEAEAPTPADRSAGADPDRLRHALRILDHAAELGGPTWAYRLQRAHLLARLGDETGARAERREAERLPAGAFDHFLVGLVHHFRGDPAAALPHFEQASRRRPGDFWPQYHVALCLLKLDRPAEAEAHLTACISRRPDFPATYLVRGYALGERGAFEAAEADFRTAEGMTLDGQARYGLLVNRGRMRVLSGRFDEAHADLEAAIELLPGRHEAYVNRAQAYRAQKKWDEARAQLDRATGLAPDLAGAYRDRARVAIERGEPAAALPDLEEAIRREAGQPRQVAEDQTDRGLILFRAERYGDALAAFDAALVARPELAQAHRLRAEALMELGRDREAVAALDRSLSRGLPDADAYRLRGLLRQALGQAADAVTDFTRALEMEPDSSNMRTKRAWAYLLDGRDLALQDFDRAIALNPENCDAHAGRGYALVLLGRHREGIEAAERAIRLAPREPDILYNAACVLAQAAGAARANGDAEDHGAQAARSGDRGLALIRQALDLKPPGQRSAFWRDVIARDPALDPIRRLEGFARLEAEYGQPSP
ncbi:MAG TPA: tetratricopeptide repeat protein, partial [Isosphaeraceae bacterium]